MEIHRKPCPTPEEVPCDFCDEPPTTHYHVLPYSDEYDYIACICDSERCMAKAMVLLAATAAQEVQA